MNGRRAALLAVCLCALALVPAWAERFSFSADSMTGSMAKGRERVVLEGKATVVSDGLVIKADHMELYGADFRYVECSGSVTVVDDERGIRLSSARLFYDRQDRLSRMTGPSVMEDRRNKVVIKGDFIENDDKREIALIQINVRILKDKISCRSEFARYDRAAKTLELSGSPWVKRDADEYRASVIQVNLDTEDIVLLGAVSGTVSADQQTPTPSGATLPLSPAPAPEAPGRDETTGGQR